MIIDKNQCDDVIIQSWGYTGVLLSVSNGPDAETTIQGNHAAPVQSSCTTKSCPTSHCNYPNKRQENNFI